MRQIKLQFILISMLIVLAGACKKNCIQPQDPSTSTGNATTTNSVLKFNGSSDYIQIPKCTSFDLGLGDFTFEARIKADTIQETFPQIMSYRDASETGFLFGLFSDGKPFVQMGQYNTGNWVAPNSQDLRDNKWHTVAITRQGSTISYYVDGASVGTLSVGLIAVRSISSAGPLNIGYDAPSSSNTSFKGEIMNVSIWNIARTGSSIAADVNGGGFAGNETGLVGYWPLNEGSGQTVYNKVSSCNSNGELGSTTSADSNDPSWVTNN